VAERIVSGGAQSLGESAVTRRRTATATASLAATARKDVDSIDHDRRLLTLRGVIEDAALLDEPFSGRNAWRAASSARLLSHVQTTYGPSWEDRGLFQPRVLSTVTFATDTTDNRL